MRLVEKELMGIWFSDIVTLGLEDIGSFCLMMFAVAMFGNSMNRARDGSFALFLIRVRFMWYLIFALDCEPRCIG